MSTRTTIHFETSGGEEYQFFVRSDGYPEGIIHSLWQMRLACNADIIKWKDLYAFIKKYDGCLGLEYLQIHEVERFFEMDKPEFFFTPFDDGYMSREGPYDSGMVSYEYHVGYKFSTISESNYDVKYNPKKCDAKNFWIQFLFGGKESFWAQIRIES